jgi:arsenate reductase
MAEGYFRKYCQGDQIYSAGIEAHGLNPLAVQVMAEDGIDISQQKSKVIDELSEVTWDIVITVCDNANERCPFLPGNHSRLHNSFEDPAALRGQEKDVLPVYRKVRDQIHIFTREFCGNTSREF